MKNKNFNTVFEEIMNKIDNKNEIELKWQQFHDDLLADDLNVGISPDALEKAYDIATEHGNTFQEVEKMYNELAEIARMAHNKMCKLL